MIKKSLIFIGLFSAVSACGMDVLISKVAQILPAAGAAFAVRGRGILEELAGGDDVQQSPWQTAHTAVLRKDELMDSTKGAWEHHAEASPITSALARERAGLQGWSVLKAKQDASKFTKK